MAKDFYAVLSLPANASPQQIRARFLALARERHPDRFVGEEKPRAELEFQSLTEAFNVLSNPERRRQHDLELTRRTPRPAEGQELLKVYLQRGVKAYKERNFPEAAANFDRATDLDPASAQAWHHLALACSHDPRWRQRAIEAITRACQLQPMNPGYLKLAGKLTLLAGMLAEAEKYYNEALTWGGEDPDVTRGLEELRRQAKKGAGRWGSIGKSGG
jgi:curved DNA-binding protein CbpA